MNSVIDFGKPHEPLPILGQISNDDKKGKTSLTKTKRQASKRQNTIAYSKTPIDSRATTSS